MKITRKRCLTHGHKWSQIEGVMLPLEFCARWFCNAERTAGWVPEPLATELTRITTERKH